MLRTFVPPNAVWIPNRESAVRAGPPPGSNCASPTKPRLSTGNSATCSCVTTPDRSDLAVSMVTADAVTATVSARPPTDRPMRSSATSPTVIVTRRRSGPKLMRSDLTA